MSLSARWIPGGWTEQEVVVRSRRFSLLLPAAPDDVLFHLEEHPDPATGLGADPYWANLWPTSIFLAEAILDATWMRGMTAIELGCGIGLAGLAAAASGMQVTLSDYNPLAVELAVENAQRCGLENVAGLVVDWRDPPAHKYDVILASDVIYDRHLHEPLLKTLAALSHERTVIWIADGGRSSSEEFVVRAMDGWQVELLDKDEQPVRSVNFGEYRRIMLRRLK